MAVSTPIVLALTLVAPATHETSARVERTYGVALGNDYLNLMLRGNDRGFTSDVNVYRLTAVRQQSLRLGLRHSIFTADTRRARRRFDIGRLYVLASRSVIAVGPLQLSRTHFAEGFYRGDLGGSDLQNFVHHWPGIHGDTFGDGLSNDYPQNPRLGVAAGLGCRADLDLSALVTAVDVRWWISTAAQVAPLATGITKVEATTGVAVEADVSSTSRVFTETSLGVGRVASNDPLLALPGGYTNELGALWGPTVVIGVRLRTGAGEWVSALFRSTRNPEGTGSRRGSGPMGWFVVEWGASGD